MIIYDRLWDTMKQKGISQYALYTTHGISKAQIQRLKQNESVTTNTLNTICNILNCKIEDICEFIKD